MKASTLKKRLADIGQAVDRASLQPLVLVAMAKFDPGDAYWDGDDAVLTRYRARDGAESSPGMIHTIIISVHPELRESWLTTVDLDDEDLEKLERQHEAEARRRAAEDREQAYHALLAVNTTDCRRPRQTPIRRRGTMTTIEGGQGGGLILTVGETSLKGDNVQRHAGFDSHCL